MEETTGKPKKLSPRENAFVLYYVGQALRDATKAAALAGWTATNGALRVTAHRLMRRPEIRAAIDELLTANALSATEVLSELSDIAKLPLYISVPTKEIGEDGKPIEVLKPNKASLIKAKHAALTTIARYHGMLIERVEQQGEFVLKVEYGEDGAKPQADNTPTETAPSAEPVPE